MNAWRWGLWLGVVLAAPCVGCGSSDTGSGGGSNDGGQPGVLSLFAVPASLDDLAQETFFDHPWPSDFRKDADGTPHYAGYPNPRAIPILDSYLALVDRDVDGFSPAAAGYLRFTGSINDATLPADPAASVQADSAVQLVDVDDASPEKGTRKLVALYYRDMPGVYWPEHTLSFMPALGHPLRAHTRYAIVVTDGVKATDGSAVGPAPELRQVLGVDAAGALTKPIADAWASAISVLGSAGITPAHIVHLSVFTTSDPTAELFAIHDWINTSYAAPQAIASDWQKVDAEATANYDAFHGRYGPSPDFQAGNIPFITEADGGGFVFKDGKPVVQREANLRFMLAVPKASACPMPAAGYPIVLQAHGTTGDYRSHFSPYAPTADLLAQKCIASMGIDQPFHGDRAGAPPNDDPQKEEVYTYNVQNGEAFRTNFRQGAVDEMQRVRLFAESHMIVPASVTGAADVKFDASKILFFGHSQGSQNGPLFLASDDRVLGGVLSGSGSLTAIALLEKESPSPSIAKLVQTVLMGLHPSEFEEENLWHPIVSMIQTGADVTDPINYVGHITLDPRSGFHNKSVYVTEGVNEDGKGDTYAPPHSQEVGAVAMGLPVQAPVIHPVAEDAYSGLQPVTVPASGLSGNIAGGAASGILAQFHPAPNDDGHFVVFDVQAARVQATQFLRNLADDPIGRVPAP